MPLEFREEVGGELVVVRMTGTLSRRDYQRFVPELDRLIRTHGSVCVMVELLSGYRGSETGAASESVKLALKHLTHVERLALVGEPRRVGRLRTLCRWFTSAEVRCFDLDNAAGARAWLRECIQDQPTMSGDASRP